MKRLGLDMGTKNLVLAYRGNNKNVVYRREINGFIVINNEPIMRNMLVSQNVPFIPRDDRLIALGAKAEEIAYSFPDVELQRPMRMGVVNKKEKLATQIMAVLVKSLIGKLDDDAILYYCVPAASIDRESNVDYHAEVLRLLFESMAGNKIITNSINEARAIIIGSRDDKTGIAISMGAGMVNVSYCLYGISIYEFSLVGAGDWINEKTSEATGEDNIEYINRIKEGLVLKKDPPTDHMERAIWVNTSILIKKITAGIINGFNRNEKQARASKPMPIVLAGGTSSPEGFVDFFRSVFSREEMPFEVGEVEIVEEPLYAVSKGCLIAAEMHE